MKVTVQLTYDMGKEVGENRIEVHGVRTVRDVVDKTRARFPEGGTGYDQLSRVTALAVNGVLVKYKKGLNTPLADGDTIAFVKAAAGG